jgi:hypothetical protein
LTLKKYGSLKRNEYILVPFQRAISRFGKTSPPYTMGSGMQKCTTEKVAHFNMPDPIQGSFLTKISNVGV